MSNLLLEEIKSEFSLNTDAALAKFIGDTRSSVSLIQSGKKAVNASLILKIHEATGWTVRRIKEELKGHEAVSFSS